MTHVSIWMGYQNKIGAKNEEISVKDHSGYSNWSLGCAIYSSSDFKHVA